MTRELDVLRDSQLLIFSPSAIFVTFLLGTQVFSSNFLAKFEAAKTASGVGFLRLTAVCAHGYYCLYFLIL